MADKNPGFTKRLQQSLSETELSPKQFAATIGIKYSTFAAYLNPKNLGKVPEWPQLVQIAQGLETSADWLLTGKHVATRNPGVVFMDAAKKYPFLKSMVPRINRAMREDRSEEAVAEMIRLLAKIELVNLRNGLRTKDKEKGDENDKE